MKNYFIIPLLFLLSFQCFALSIDGDYYFNNGMNKSKTGDYKGALVDFTKAMALDPNNGGFYYNRGRCKLLKGDNTGGNADLKVAQKLLKK